MVMFFRSKMSSQYFVAVPDLDASGQRRATCLLCHTTVHQNSKRRHMNLVHADVGLDASHVLLSRDKSPARAKADRINLTQVSPILASKRQFNVKPDLSGADHVKSKPSVSATAPSTSEMSESAVRRAARAMLGQHFKYTSFNLHQVFRRMVPGASPDVAAAAVWLVDEVAHYVTATVRDRETAELHADNKDFIKFCQIINTWNRRVDNTLDPSFNWEASIQDTTAGRSVQEPRKTAVPSAPKLPPFQAPSPEWFDQSADVTAFEADLRHIFKTPFHPIIQVNKPDGIDESAANFEEYVPTRVGPRCSTPIDRPNSAAEMYVPTPLVQLPLDNQIKVAIPVVKEPSLLQKTDGGDHTEPVAKPASTDTSGDADADEPVLQLQTDDNLSDVSCLSNVSTVSKRSKRLLQEAERSAPVMSADRISQKTRQGKPSNIIGLENFNRPPPEIPTGSSGAARTSVMVRLVKRSATPQEPSAAAATTGTTDDEPPAKKLQTTSSRVTVSMTAAQFAEYRSNRYNVNSQN